MWFPAGDRWFDFFDATEYKGGTEAVVKKDIYSFPLFVKGGWILPMQPYTMRPASTPLSNLVLRVYPGEDGADNIYTLYEDDGESLEYTNGKFATTQLRYKRTGNIVSLTVSPANGEYKGQPKERSYTFELPAITKVRSVKVKSGGVKSEKFESQFDQITKMLKIEVKSQSVEKAVNVEIVLE